MKGTASDGGGMCSRFGTQQRGDNCHGGIGECGEDCFFVPLLL
jgi:hypothetical protein